MISADLIYFLTLQIFICKFLRSFSSTVILFFDPEFTDTPLISLEFVQFPQGCKISDVHCFQPISIELERAISLGALICMRLI